MNRQLPPLILTYKQLEAVLLPITIGYAWGIDTIHDLWKKGAPVPVNGTTEARIVLPKQLAIWLTDVLERQGKPLDAAATVYANLLKGTG